MTRQKWCIVQLQALPNIKLITREVIYQAEQWEKARKYKNAKAGVARQIQSNEKH